MVAAAKRTDARLSSRSRGHRRETRWLSITRNREFRECQQQLAFSAQDMAQLSETRHRGGAAGSLEGLSKRTNYFNAELEVAQAQSNELDSSGRDLSKLRRRLATVRRGRD